MVTLRGDLAGPALAAAVASRHRLRRCRRCAGSRFAGDATASAWMSPDELMLFVAPVRGAGDGRRGSRAALAGVHHLAVDVSDARVLFRARRAPARARCWPRARRSTSRPRPSAPGDFRRTRLGQVAAAFWMPAPETFDLICFRSVAGFVADWLANAARPGSLPATARRAGGDAPLDERAGEANDWRRNIGGGAGAASSA